MASSCRASPSPTARSSTKATKTDRAANPKLTQPLLDTPRSIVVIPRQLIEDTGSTTLAEALRTVPGITFGAAEGGNPIGDRPFIRGFDSQGSTFLDGVRDIGAQSRETFAIDEIQIVRGSDSTLGGRGTAGGSINIVSKLPRDEDFIRADASYGNADYKRVTGDLNYRIAPNVAVRIAAMAHDQGFAGRDEVKAKRWGVAPSITIGIGTPTRLTVGYYHLDGDELPDSGIPYLYAIANSPFGTALSEPAIGTVMTAGGATGRVKRSTFYGLKDRDFRDTKTDQFTIRAEHDFGNGLTLRNTARFSRTAQNYIYTQPDDSQGNVFGTTIANATNAAGVTSFTNGGTVWRRANTRQGDTKSMINQTDVYGTFETGSIKHSIAAGVEIAWEDATRGTYVTHGFTNAAGTELLSTGSMISPRCNSTTVARYNCTSLFTPNANDPWMNTTNDTSNVAAPIAKSLPIADTRTHGFTRAAYAFDSISITDALILNLGIRVDQFRSKVTPGLPATATTPRYSVTRRDTIVDGQAGLVFKPTPDTSIYASYATASTPPNSLIGEGQEANGLSVAVATSVGAGAAPIATAQAISDALKVERTKSYEVGAKADLFDHTLQLSIAGFRTETKNLRALSDANTVAFVGERRIKGVEFSVIGNITDWWSVFGGYTYLDAKIVDGGFTTLTAAAIMQGATVIQGAKTVGVASVNTGRRATQTAKNSASIWTNVTPTKQLSIGGGAFYTGRVFGGYADNRTAVQNAVGIVTVNPATRILERSIPGYWRFDARIGYQLTEHIGLSVNAQNLTNKIYFS